MALCAPVRRPLALEERDDAIAFLPGEHSGEHVSLVLRERPLLHRSLLPLLILVLDAEVRQGIFHLVVLYTKI